LREEIKEKSISDNLMELFISKLKENNDEAITQIYLLFTRFYEKDISLKKFINFETIIQIMNTNYQNGKLINETINFIQNSLIFINFKIDNVDTYDFNLPLEDKNEILKNDKIEYESILNNINNQLDKIIDILDKLDDDKKLNLTFGQIIPLGKNY
jgi:hypothetical protein